MRSIVVFMFAVALAASLCACSSGAPAASSPSSASAASSSASAGRVSATADTVFGFPEQYDVSSGSGESIGTVAVFSAASSDCSPENLELWCNQYVRWGLDEWCVVEYSDKPGFGVYASGSVVDAGVALAPDYSVADDSGAESYVFKEGAPEEDGTLVPLG